MEGGRNEGISIYTAAVSFMDKKLQKSSTCVRDPVLDVTTYL